MRGLTVAAALIFSHALPSMNGTTLHVQIVDVTYAPGGSSKPHSHTCPAIVYVVDGALCSQTRGEPARTYGRGETFYEAPNRVHQISANASKTTPAHFLAYFICDTGASR